MNTNCLLDGGVDFRYGVLTITNKHETRTRLLGLASLSGGQFVIFTKYHLAQKSVRAYTAWPLWTFSRRNEIVVTLDKYHKLPKVPQNTDSSRITYPNEFLLEQQPEHHHHHSIPNYHKRRMYPEFHFIDNDERAKGYQPRPALEDVDKGQSSNTTMQIPLSFIRNINQYNVTDLLLNFVEEGPQDTLIRSRFGDEDDGARSKYRDSAKIPKAAGCIPETTTISLAQSSDPSVLYIPQCTRVERCGGCCSHALLSCQPKETETLTYEVMKTQYTGGKKLKYLGKEVVVVEKHVSCKCDCKVKEEVVMGDCNMYQEYRESECRCACTNVDEEKKCYRNSPKMLWNPELCACQCRDVLNCTTGYSFDQIDCRCVPSPIRRRLSRRGYASRVDSISPLDDEN